MSGSLVQIGKSKEFHVNLEWDKDAPLHKPKINARMLDSVPPPSAEPRVETKIIRQASRRHLAGAAGVGVGATALAAAVANHRGRGKKLTVAKGDLEWHQRRTSAVHGIGAGAGAAILATGASRSGMVGDTLARGFKNPAAVGRGLAYTRAATQPLVSAAHGARGVGGLVDLVPTRWRPALAMGLGASILHREIPRIRQNAYTNVVVAR